MTTPAHKREEDNNRYIMEKIDPFMNKMLVSILTDKPSDVLKYMAFWVEGEKVKGTQRESSERAERPVRQAVKSPEESVREAEESAPKETPRSRTSHSESEESEEGFDMDEMLKQRQLAAKQGKAKMRAGVSAEAYGAHNKKGDFKARVIEKSSEEKERIREKLVKSFMFKALEEKELETCIMAMEIKQYQ